MRFVVADDHPFTLAGIAGFVTGLGHTVLAGCQNGTMALEAIKCYEPDIALLDVNMGEMDGLAVLERVKMTKIPVRIVLITSHNEVSIYKKAMELGADGYILKSYAQEELDACIRSISKGIAYTGICFEKDLNYTHACQVQELLIKLSFTEKKVFQEIAAGKNTKEIAKTLLLSVKTVETHRTHIIEKLQLPKEKNALIKFIIKQKQG